MGADLHDGVLWGAALVAAATLAVWARETARPLAHRVFKVGTVALLLLLVAVHGRPPEYRACLAVALGVSLLGDFILTLDERAFVWGLGAFLGALLVYSFGFIMQGALDPLRLAVILPAALIGTAALRPIWRRLGSLRVPVAAYVAALCMLLWTSVTRVGVAGVSAASAGLGVAGAMAFMLGDAFLAYRRFGARRVPYGLELGTYFVAQTLLAATALVP